MGTIPKNGSKKVLKRSKEHRLSAQPGKVDTALEISEIFATTAQHVADIAGIPGLGEAAAVVVSILERVQDMRDNKGEFQQLAQEAKELVSSIRDAFALALDNATQTQAESVRKQIQELNDDIQKLLRVLKEINQFAQLKLKRNWFWRFIYTRYDIQTIRQYRDAMQHAHTNFNVRTNVVLRVDMAQVHFKTDQILEAMKRLEQQQSSGALSPAAPQISYNHSSDSDSRSRAEFRERWLQQRPRPPSVTPIQNYGHGATIYSTVDNSVHDNSRVHYGDIVNTNTYNSGPAQYSQGSVNRRSHPNYNRRSYGYQHQGNPRGDDRYY